VTTPDTLPDDIAALRALVLTAWAERDVERAEKGRLVEERDQLAGQNDRLRHLLRQLQRMQFGQRSEKLDPDQFNLALEDLEQAIAAGEAEQEKADPGLRKARSESGAPAAVRCPSTCRGSRSSSNRKTPPARAAAARCM
jgi:transposase